MTEWDLPLDDHAPGSACIALVNAAVWLICAPFDLYARLRNGRGAGGDAGREEADVYGAVEGAQFHNGSPISTGAQRDHG